MGTKLPADWGAERFKVVDAGNGNVGLWSPGQKRFIQMANSANMLKTHVVSDGHFPSNWGWEAFKVVDAGNGAIADIPGHQAGQWAPRALPPSRLVPALSAVLRIARVQGPVHLPQS